MDMFHTICVNVTDFSQPRMEFDWNEKTQNFEVSRVIHYDTDYDLASFTLLPDGVTAEELIASSPTWQKAVEAIRVSDHSVPVLAVNHLEAVADFASGRAQITQGRGWFTTEFARYETLPEMLVPAVVEQAKKLGNLDEAADD